MTNLRNKVLIVDDEQEVVEGLRRTLRHENYDLITTTSPLVALEHLEAGGVDVIISDIDMPEMTGLELVAMVHKKYPQVVRILLTGDASVESALSAINDGAVHKYLTKPWRAKDLRETLRQAIVGLEALRQAAVSASAAASNEKLQNELERAYPGFSAVNRVNGAYLLNDIRVVELTNKGSLREPPFAAARWMPLADDATVDIRTS